MEIYNERKYLDTFLLTSFKVSNDFPKSYQNFTFSQNPHLLLSQIFLVVIGEISTRYLVKNCYILSLYLILFA